MSKKRFRHYMCWLLIFILLSSLVWTGMIIWRIQLLRDVRLYGDFPDNISKLQQHTDPNNITF
jgi:hypothetical protein